MIPFVDKMSVSDSLLNVSKSVLNYATIIDKPQRKTSASSLQANNNKEYNEFKKDILSTDEYNTPLQSSPKLGEQQNHYNRIDEKKDKRLVRSNSQSSTTSSPEIKNTRSPKLK